MRLVAGTTLFLAAFSSFIPTAAAAAVTTSVTAARESQSEPTSLFVEVQVSGLRAGASYVLGVSAGSSSTQSSPQLATADGTADFFVGVSDVSLDVVKGTFSVGPADTSKPRLLTRGFVVPPAPKARVSVVRTANDPATVVVRVDGSGLFPGGANLIDVQIGDVNGVAQDNSGTLRDGTVHGSVTISGVAPSVTSGTFSIGPPKSSEPRTITGSFVIPSAASPRGLSAVSVCGTAVTIAVIGAKPGYEVDWGTDRGYGTRGGNFVGADGRYTAQFDLVANAGYSAGDAYTVVVYVGRDGATEKLTATRKSTVSGRVDNGGCPV